MHAYANTHTLTDTHIKTHDTNTLTYLHNYRPDENSTDQDRLIFPVCCDWLLFYKARWCEANVEIYRRLFFGSVYMGTTFSQRGVAGSHPKIWSNPVKTSLRWQEETESNLFPMGQKHLLFLLLTKHISVCWAAISTPALISSDQWVCI